MGFGKFELSLKKGFLLSPPPILIIMDPNNLDTSRSKISVLRNVWCPNRSCHWFVRSINSIGLIKSLKIYKNQFFFLIQLVSVNFQINRFNIFFRIDSLSNQFDWPSESNHQNFKGFFFLPIQRNAIIIWNW